MGGSKRAYAYSKALESDVVICYKQRAKANVISHMELIGDVTGKNVVLVDDMVDTAGTLTKAADLMIERGFKAELIEAVGRGEREPAVPTEDEVVEPRNRRAVVVVR